MADAADEGSPASGARRLRYVATALLLLFAIATGAATFESSVVQRAAMPWRLLLATPPLLALAFVLLRHRALAFVAVAAPFAGVLWGHAIGILLGGQPATPGLALAFGIVVSFLYADCFIARLLDDVGFRRAASSGVRAALKPMLAGIVLASGVLVMLLRNASLSAWALLTAVQCVSAALAGFIMAVSVSAFISPDEDLIAILNRARERQRRAAWHLTFVVEPRWGLSITGIGFVAAVLGYFGAERAMAGASFLLLAVVAIALVASLALLRRWKPAVAIALAITVVALLALWCRAALRLDRFGDDLALAQAIGVGFTLIVGAYARNGAPADAVEDVSAVLVAAGLAALLVVVMQSRALAPVLIVASGQLAALLLAPALTTTLEILAPRRRSASELYARRP